MSNNTLITKRDFTSKKGVTIKSGEKVTVRFDVKGKDGIRDENPYLAGFVSLNTVDGRRIAMRIKSAGFTEPDGWSYDGSPSWLLALGLI